MKEITIGRASDNNVCLQDGTVSLHHAKLILNGGRIILQDLNSTNGTFVNGQLVRGARELNRQDIVRIGNKTLPWLNYLDGSAPINMHPGHRPPTSGNNPGTPPLVPSGSQPNGSNGMAIAGFVCSLLPFTVLFGLIFSIIGLSKASEQNGQGRGLAMAGVIISAIWLFITFIVRFITILI